MSIYIYIYVYWVERFSLSNNLLAHDVMWKETKNGKVERRLGGYWASIEVEGVDDG